MLRQTAPVFALLGFSILVGCSASGGSPAGTSRGGSESGGAGAGGPRFEVLFKGFGQGREAVFKALMTSEGDDVRPFVARVTDNTPIKIGGTRAKKTRRL